MSKIKDLSFSMYAKFSEKMMSYPMMRIRACGYQGVIYVSFSEHFAYVLSR